jgi:hypothetical protein
MAAVLGLLLHENIAWVGNQLSAVCASPSIVLILGFSWHEDVVFVCFPQWYPLFLLLVFLAAGGRVKPYGASGLCIHCESSLLLDEHLGEPPVVNGSVHVSRRAVNIREEGR